QLGDQLTRVAIEQPGHGTVDAVPAATEIAGAVSEQTYREHSPQAACAVDRNRAHRIVHLHYAFDELDAETNQQPRHESDNRRAYRVDEPAGRRDCDQAGKQAVGRHRGVGFAETDPHIEDGAERARAPRKHRVDGDRSDTQIARARSAQRAARIEAEPAESEDEAAD